MKNLRKMEFFQDLSTVSTGRQATKAILNVIHPIRAFIDFVDQLDAEEMDELLFMSFISILRGRLDGAENQLDEISNLLDSLAKQNRKA